VEPRTIVEKRPISVVQHEDEVSTDNFMNKFSWKDDENSRSQVSRGFLGVDEVALKKVKTDTTEKK
jgi:hypothetical protein